jgi:hypothetical protein
MASWDVQLRLQNYSSIPMRFAATNIQIAFDNGAAAKRAGTAAASAIGPESADVVVTVTAVAAAGGPGAASPPRWPMARSLNYTLGGSGRCRSGGRQAAQLQDQAATAR